MRGFGSSLDRLAALMVAGLQLGLWAGPAAAQVVADDLVCAGCVQATDIANGTIGPNKLIPGSINAATIANSSIGPNKLIPGTINTATLANNAIRSNKILDGAVGLHDLSPAVQQIIADLQAKVAAMEALFEVVSVEDIGRDLNGDGFIEDIPIDLDGDGVPDADSELLPTVIFEGVNLQIVNGHPSERTQSLNALGNLIVGYNEDRPNFSFRLCSDGGFPDNEPVTGCEANGHVWADNHKSGSHNLVVGAENGYSRAGGVVFGERNMINRQSATVTAGRRNTASGTYASISGGDGGEASGRASSVNGGGGSIASGATSSVSGGLDNTASGFTAAVSGGIDSTASGSSAVVSGGDFNEASGGASVVSGGHGNAASATFSVVSGGDFNTASGDYAAVSGGDSNTANGEKSTVSGGNGVTINGDCDWGGEGTVFGDGTC